MTRRVLVLAWVLCLLPVTLGAQPAGPNNPAGVTIKNNGTSLGPQTILNCKGNVSCVKNGGQVDIDAGSFATATATVSPTPTRTATPTATVTATATATASSTPTPTATRTPNACATAASSWFGVFFGGQYGQSASDAPLCLPIPTVTISPTPTATRTATPSPTPTGYVMGPQGCDGTDKIYGFNAAGEILCGADLQAVAPTATAVTPTPTGTATPTPVACPTDALGRGGVIAAHPEKCGVPIASATPTATVTATADPTATRTAVICPDGEALNAAHPEGCVTLPTPDGGPDGVGLTSLPVSPTPTPAANQVHAGPTSGGFGAAVWRALFEADIPDEIARDSEIPAPYPTPTTAIPADCSELSGCEPNAIVCADVPGCQSADTITQCSDVRACATPTSAPTTSPTPVACPTDAQGRGGVIANRPDKCGVPVATVTPTPTETATLTATVTPTAVACAANFVDAVVGPGSDAAATCVPVRTPVTYPTPTVVESATPTPVVCRTATSSGAQVGGLFKANPDECAGTPAATATPTPVVCATDASGHLGGLYGANPELCKTLPATATPVATPTAPYPHVVQEGDSTVVANATTHDFVSTDFDVTESPTGEANIALDANVVKVGGASILSSQIPTVLAADGVSRCLGDDNDACETFETAIGMLEVTGVAWNFGPTPTASATPTVTATPTATSATPTKTAGAAATPTIIATPTATGATITPTPLESPRLLVRGQPAECRQICTTGINSGSTTYQTSDGNNTTFTTQATKTPLLRPSYFRDLSCGTWNEMAVGTRKMAEIQVGKNCSAASDGASASCTWTTIMRADLVGTFSRYEFRIEGTPPQTGILTEDMFWHWVFTDVGGNWMQCCVELCGAP